MTEKLYGEEAVKAFEASKPPGLHTVLKTWSDAQLEESIAWEPDHLSEEVYDDEGGAIHAGNWSYDGGTLLHQYGAVKTYWWDQSPLIGKVLVAGRDGGIGVFAIENPSESLGYLAPGEPITDEVAYLLPDLDAEELRAIGVEEVYCDTFEAFRYWALRPGEEAKFKAWVDALNEEEK